jgi:hypothetical protein
VIHPANLHRINACSIPASNIASSTEKSKKSPITTSLLSTKRTKQMLQTDLPVD